MITAAEPLFGEPADSSGRHVWISPLMLLAVILLFVCLADVAFLLSTAPGWWATTVSGSLFTSSGKPERAGKVYFANRVTGDIFLAPVDTQGTFSVDLPPGAYDLRSRHGAVLLPDISVGELPVRLGPVKESSFDLWPFLQGENASKWSSTKMASGVRGRDDRRETAGQFGIDPWRRRDSGPSLPRFRIEHSA